MADKAHKKVDKQIADLDKRLQQIYGRAEHELQAKYSDFMSKYQTKAQIWKEQLDAGEITKSEYASKIQGQIFQQKQWQSKVHEMSQTLLHTNQLATKLVNGQLADVFIGNANYSLYSMEHSAGVSFGFSMYDKTTVARLVKEEPTLLPVKKVDEAADLAWNQKKITGAVTQGILQGESTAQVAGRLTQVVGMNQNSALTNARTAMTGAQNAGRNQALVDAKALGLSLVKEWMATLDGRTRYSHRHMDGEKIKVGDKWHPQKFSNGLRYPADPDGPPWEVYNCRCTLVGDVTDYPSEYKRYDNIDGKPVKNMTYEQWAKAKGLQMEKQKAASKAGKLTKAEAKQMAAAETAAEALKTQMQEMVNDNGIWTGIWQNDVTLADYPAKQTSIQAKREYYEQRIAQLEGMDLDEYHQQKLEQFKGHLQALNDFEDLGKEYMKLYTELQDQQKIISGFRIKLGGQTVVTQEQRDAAFWAKSSQQADDMFRQVTKDVWATATKDQKYAAWDYTAGSGGFNRPLRGYEGSWHNPKGIGNVPLDYEGKAREIEELTTLLEHSRLQQDTWLQRGIETMEGMSNFVGVPEATLRAATQEELEQLLLGKEISDAGFMSCGSAKGTGFSGSILNVFCPEGTQGLYVEPFSEYGHGGGKSWDGKSDQSYFGHELETLLQRNTKFRIIKVEKSGGRIYLDIDVVGQDPHGIQY